MLNVFIFPQDTIAYSIVPRPNITEFFYLHPETGDLSLAKPLTLMKEIIHYQVCTLFQIVDHIFYIFVLTDHS